MKWASLMLTGLKMASQQQKKESGRFASCKSEGEEHF
jgi:hypothetical protein